MKMRKGYFSQMLKGLPMLQIADLSGCTTDEVNKTMLQIIVKLDKSIYEKSPETRRFQS
jgi:hypothetical protein